MERHAVLAASLLVLTVACKPRSETSAVKDLTPMFPDAHDDLSFLRLTVDGLDGRTVTPTLAGLEFQLDGPDGNGVGGTAVDPVFLAARQGTVRQGTDRTTAEIGLASPLVLPLERRGSGTSAATGLNLGKLVLAETQPCPLALAAGLAALHRAVPPTAALDVTTTPDEVRVEGASYLADSLTVVLTCSYKAKAKDGGDYKLKGIATVRLGFAQAVFAVPPLDPDFPAFETADLALDENGKGTRFFQNSHDIATNLERYARGLVLRWDLGQRKLVVDDRTLVDGRSVADVPSAVIAAQTLKAGRDQLARDVPEVGSRIAFASEDPGQAPNVRISIGTAGEAVAGFANFVFDDRNGAIVEGRIALSEKSVLAPQRAQFEAMKKAGLVQDVDKELDYLYQRIVLHEFGHTLGLRHNFADVDVGTDGALRDGGVMDYSHHLPMVALGAKLAYGPHDLASLRILYHDRASDPDAALRTNVAAVKAMPLSSEDDEFASISQPGLFRDRALRVLKASTVPAVAAARGRTPDFDAFLASLYEEAYRSPSDDGSL